MKTEFMKNISNKKKEYKDMNVTKNKIIEALNYLGEFPKTSLKKDELLTQLNNIYNEEVERLVYIINTEIYDLIKRLVKADEKGIEVENEYELEVDFLESILVVDEPVIIDNKIHIKFNKGMKEKLKKLVNHKNEESVMANQIIVDFIINVVNIYGMIQDYEMVNMLNKILKLPIDMQSLFFLMNSQVDLKNEVMIAENEDDEEEVYLTSYFVVNPEDIIFEREKRDLYYKEYTFEEIEENKPENLMDSKEAQDIIQFLEKRKVRFAEEAVFTMILYIMSAPQLNVDDFMNLIKIDFEDIDEANEYLQLIMNLHNNIPHYALYGYSPNELMKIKIEKRKLEENKKKEKIGRNDPCPCGSGKKYKKCCMNKVINVDFRNEKYDDCIEEEYSRMFFVLKNLLFDYTNRKYHINDELEDFEDICEAQPEDIIEIREKIWNDKNVIKEYINENPNKLNSDFIYILKQWNEKKINKEFMLYKYEDEYNVFIDDDNIYYVKGLKDRIREMIPESELPMFVKTVLLPLNNKIIYDSYIEQYNMYLRKGARDIWNQKYKEMLKENKVKYEL